MCPDAVGHLASLRTLELQGCSGMTALPDAVSRLTALRSLELRECRKLAALPHGLAALTGLEDLLLMGCSALREVPAWVMALPALRGEGCEAFFLASMPPWHLPQNSFQNKWLQTLTVCHT